MVLAKNRKTVEEKAMKILLSLLIIVTSSVTIAQTNDIKDLPGYIDFGNLNSIYGEPKVRINIGEKLLGFVGSMAKNGDKGVSDILSKLQAVRVEIYDLNKDAGPAINLVKKISAELQSREWEPIVVVQDEEKQVRIFIKTSNDVMNGLVVMVVNANDEAVFINIIGEIDPSQVGKVTKALKIDLGV